MEALPWKQLLQLFIFALFVYAVIELLKDLRAVKRKETTPGTWSRLLGVIVAYTFCYAFDYGVMSRVVQVGDKVRSWASVMDYLGTAALIAMGAAWVFDKVVTLQKQYEAARAEASKVIGDAKRL